MLDIILNVFFVLLAISMIALILLQRGAGAQAGSGFGAGASGTVFGAQGSANFLSKTTKWLAVLFFALSLFMAWRATHQNLSSTNPAAATGSTKTEAVEDLGVMGDVKDEPAVPASNPLVPSVSPVIPSATAPATTPAAIPAADAPAAQQNAAPPATNDGKEKEAAQKE